MKTLLKTYSTYSDFLVDWQNPNHVFEMETSGSTGASKIIVLNRNHLVLSAKQTALAIPKVSDMKMLCCLPTHKMGGFMQLVRATVWNVDVIIIPPVLNPLEHSSNLKDAENISISPMQLTEIMKNTAGVKRLQQFKVVLVGGAATSEAIVTQLLNWKNIYFTYGMTETYSHIALRKMPSDYFKPVEGITIRTDELNELSIKGEITGHQWLKTGDVAEIVGDIGFKLIGRIDHLINSGGVKFVAEALEQSIKDIMPMAYFIKGEPNEQLGEEITLIVPKAIAKQQLDNINAIIIDKFGKYAKIRKVKTTTIHIDLVTGKINRKA